jgi:hypothetical protein
MSANVVSVGNNGGLAIATFTGAGSSGPLLYQNQAAPAGSLQPGIVGPLIKSKAYTFQLIKGTSANYAIKIQGTIDPATAAGNAAEWFDLPGASDAGGTPQWANPLTPSNPALFVNAPVLAFNAVASGADGTNEPTGTAILEVYAFEG